MSDYQRSVTKRKSRNQRRRADFEGCGNYAQPVFISSGSRALQGWIRVSGEPVISNVYSLFNLQDIFDKAGLKGRTMRLVKWNEMKWKQWYEGTGKVWKSFKRWKEENEAKCPKIINALKVHSPGFIHRDEGFRNAPHFVEGGKKKTCHGPASRMVPPCGGKKKRPSSSEEHSMNALWNDNE